MHIAMITAGGAGMFCGSCMHDNTWARALMQHGHEVSLIPTYTPIRVDEENNSLDRVFFGGINVYLNDKFSWWKYAPGPLKRLLNNPSVIRWATKRSVSNNADDLGKLTLSMLRGESGPHREAIEELDSYVSDHLKPDVVIFSNALLSGALRELKKRYQGPILCVLQGDDVFLDGLREEFREPVIELMSERAREFDGFIVHSEFYRDYISQYLSLPRERFSILPLGIDFTGHDGTSQAEPRGPFTVGYFARIAPEKGLHNLIPAFIKLREQIPDAQLNIGGYLGPPFKSYLEDCLRTSGVHQSAIRYQGSPATQKEKVDFFKAIDILSVPTEFLEPKGIYVLEALANGVPVVQPEHGSFPEIIRKTEGGVLVPPRNPVRLAEGMMHLSDHSRRYDYGRRGWEKVRQAYSLEAMARETTHIVQQLLAGR